MLFDAPDDVSGDGDADVIGGDDPDFIGGDDDIDDDVVDGYISRPQISHLDVLQPLGEDQLLVDCHSQQLEIHIVVYHDENGKM